MTAYVDALPVEAPDAVPDFAPPRRTTFGANLRRVRLDAGVTQAELARRLGLKRPTPISLWERSAAVPAPDTVARVARALNVSPAVLLRGVVTPYDALRDAPPPAAEPAFPGQEDWITAGRVAGPALRRSLRAMIAEVARVLGTDDRLGPADARRRRRSAARAAAATAVTDPAPPPTAPPPAPSPAPTPPRRAKRRA